MTVDRQFVVAIARAFDILGCFREDRSFLTNLELARMTGMPRSSISRLTHTLVKLGYLEYDTEDGAYRLGLRVMSLQPPALAGAGIRDIAGPRMAELAARIGETVMLTVYEDFAMIVVQCDSRSPSIVASRFMGWRYPIRGTAMGRAYVASCAAHERQRIVDHVLSGPSQPDAFEHEMDAAIDSYRADGYCIALGVARPGVHSIARPVDLPRLGRRAVLTCGGLAHRMPERHLRERVAPLLLRSAADIEGAVAARH